MLVSAQAAEISSLIPIGHTVGIQMSAEGVLVVQLDDVQTADGAAQFLCGLFTAEQLEQFVARHRVKTAGRLVKDEQSGSVGECKSDKVFHPHTGGELVHALVIVQAEACHMPGVRPRIPGRVKAPGGRGYVGEALLHVEVNSAQYDAHFLFTRRLASGKLVSEDGYSPSLRFYHAEDGLQRGGLACAVAAYQPHYASLAEGE